VNKLNGIIKGEYMNLLLKDVESLKKVGPKSKKALNQIGIYRISDLLHYYPRDYETIEGLRTIESLNPDETAYIRGRIDSTVTISRFDGRVMVRFTLRDDTGRIQVMFFNQPYIKKTLNQNDWIILKGKYSVKNNRKMITNPKIIKSEEFEQLTKIKLKPIYPLSKEVTLKQLTGYVNQALEIMKNQISDYMDNAVREKYALASLSFAYEKIHYPLDKNNLEIAKRRLAFDEFFLFQMAMRRVREKVKKQNNAFNLRKNKGIERFISGLPFRLTGAQEKALDDVFMDMHGETTMVRLIQGDVGSGKTIIATICMLNTVLNGYQCAMMAPTEVLAKQHYHSLSTQLSEFNVTVGVLTGSMTKKQKAGVYEQLKEGSIDVIIGTHALIQEHVEFKDLALVITDEQHRFGVMQREALVNKGRYPHTLVMSATPIPRTLALIVYGDLDISIVDELPAGRKKIDTFLVSSTYRERIFKFAIKEVQEGRNVYFVCPMVEDNEELQLANVESYVESLREFMPSTIQIGMLHGRMKGKEKTAIMDAFLSYSIQVLVSTTVIEVGVNVPNSTLMIIENAERFGLAQLHQLRGRVGRSDLQSYCVLISDTKSTETKKKLKFLRDHDDGFELAEYDLKTRGPGQLFGLAQSGVPFFRLANLYEDKELLEMTQTIVENTEIDASIDEQLELFYYKFEGNIGI
jgi:ATP-dependent DNA helicase RecG